MFNREVIEQLSKTNDLLKHLILKVGEGNRSMSNKLGDLQEEVGQLVEYHQQPKAEAVDPVPPFPEKAPKRSSWGTLSNSHRDINPRHDVGMAIAIPTRVWSKARLTWNTVHLLGYICPKASKDGYVVTDEVDVVVVDRKGIPKRYTVKDFANEYPYFYRVSNV